MDSEKPGGVFGESCIEIKREHTHMIQMHGGDGDDARGKRTEKGREARGEIDPKNEIKKGIAELIEQQRHRIQQVNIDKEGRRKKEGRRAHVKLEAVTKKAVQFSFALSHFWS